MLGAPQVSVVQAILLLLPRLPCENILCSTKALARKCFLTYLLNPPLLYFTLVLPDDDN